MKQIFKHTAFLHYKVMCATDNPKPIPKPHHTLICRFRILKSPADPSFRFSGLDGSLKLLPDLTF